MFISSFSNVSSVIKQLQLCFFRNEAAFSDVSSVMKQLQQCFFPYEAAIVIFFSSLILIGKLICCHSSIRCDVSSDIKKQFSSAVSSFMKQHLWSFFR
jgi:hypothetical protein